MSIDGIDIRDMKLADLAAVVGVVSQETYLLHTTVRENLRYAKPDATDAEIEDAARAAQIHDLIAGLPDGYDTMVGSRGHRFSGGEKQRLAIARTLLRDPRVLVLDEATSALDTETERAVQHAFDNLAAGPHHHHHRPPALHRARRRPDRRPGPRPHRRGRHPRQPPGRQRPLRRARRVGLRSAQGGSLGNSCAGAHAEAGRRPARRRDRRGPASPVLLHQSCSTIDEEWIGMTLFQRAHDIVSAKANKALDSAEKPDEMLDLSYEQMLDQITQVRRGLVAIAASRKQIELQEQQLQHSVDHLQDQAKAALGQGREDLAREALSRKAAAQQQIDAMEPQHEQLTQEEQKLEQTLAALQTRVNNFRTQKEVLKAQYTAAQAETSVGESAAGISRPSATPEPNSSAPRTRSPRCRPARAPSMSCWVRVLEDVGGDTDDIQKELDRRRDRRRGGQGTGRAQGPDRPRRRRLSAAGDNRELRRSAGARAEPTQTDLMVQNSRMPWYESSRPYPDVLTPPNGSSG